MKTTMPHLTSKKWKIFIVLIVVMLTLGIASAAVIIRHNSSKLSSQSKGLDSSQKTDKAESTMNSFQEAAEQPNQTATQQSTPSVNCAEQNKAQQSKLDQVQQDLYYGTYLSAKQLNLSASHIPTDVVQESISRAYATYETDLSAQESISKSILTGLNCTPTISIAHLPR